MGKESNNKTDAEIYAAPKRNILQLTIGINKMTTGQPGLNGFALRNELLLAQGKAEICKKNGRVMPATAIALQAQAQRNIAAASTAQKNAAVAAKAPRKVLYKKGATVFGATTAILDAEATNIVLDHSRKLLRNYLVANPGTARIAETDAHHIVAWLAALAADARTYIFAVGIGVNDADNCAILPRFLTTAIPGMPDAIAHQHIHTIKYYINVYATLLDIPAYNQTEVRIALRDIKSQLIDGTFPY